MSNLAYWLKEHRTAVVFWLGLAVIISLSFGLGYLTAGQSGSAPIIIEKNSE